MSRPDVRIIIPVEEYPEGTIKPDPLILNDRTYAVIVTILRRTLEDPSMLADSNSLVGMTAFTSYDNGNRWGIAGGFETYGGLYIRRDDTVAQDSNTAIKIPSGEARQFKVELRVDKATKVSCLIEELMIPETNPLMMAIAFDAVGSTSSAANVSSLTTAAFTIAGSNRLLMGGIASGAGTPVDPTSMKWGGSGGTDLTKRGSTVNVGSFGKVSQYSLVAPATGSNTLYGSWGSNQDETVIGGVSYTGVDQSTPHGTQNTASGPTGLTATVNVTSASGELVSDVVFFLDVGGNITAVDAGSGQVPRVDIDNVGGGDFEAFGMSEEAGAASVTMSWSVTTGTTTAAWGILGIPIKPAADPDTLMGQAIL